MKQQMQAHALRDTANAIAQGFGLPADRMAHMAARRAFVEMKQVFMRAAADVQGSLGDKLQQRVRAANQPVELWRLRAVLLASLPAGHERALVHRIELHRQLDSLFPFNACATVPMALGTGF